MEATERRKLGKYQGKKSLPIKKKTMKLTVSFDVAVEKYNQENYEDGVLHSLELRYDQNKIKNKLDQEIKLAVINNKLMPESKNIDTTGSWDSLSFVNSFIGDPK